MQPISTLKQRGIYLKRMESFISPDRFNKVNIHGKLVKARDTSCVKLEKYSVPFGTSPLPKFEEAIKGPFEPAAIGTVIGPSWSTHWFRVTLSIPHGWADQDVFFRWGSGCEALLWNGSAEPVIAFSEQRSKYRLPQEMVQSGNPIIFYLEVACNEIQGNGANLVIQPPIPDRTFTVSVADLSIYNPHVWRLYEDFELIRIMAITLPSDSIRREEALYAANAIINIFEHPSYGDSDDSLWESCKKAQEVADSFLAVKNGVQQHAITAIGNCHIDTAWLWDYGETRRKCARSWATQLQLMQDFPNYKFACSQMQQLEWLRQDYPGLFDRIKQATKTGQFIPIGGTWVEMDCNLPSGESYARQFLYGQKWLKEHFGMHSDIFWLPDTFGYNAQLPQIMTESGIRYFFTTKLRWNNMNTFPHNAFNWEGLDGTTVLTYIPPSNGYDGDASINDMVDCRNRNQERDRNNNSLLAFGYGDGGGGPTDVMLRRIERLENVADLPTIRYGTPSEYFSTVLEGCRQKLFTWSGELYFELHRGTYTSQALTKYYNRLCERMLYQAELLSVLRQILQGSLAAKGEYPRERLDSAWQAVLLNQFHDVIPGSSIEKVYEDATKIYVEAHDMLAEIINDALSQIITCTKEGAFGKDEKSLLLFNTGQFPCTKVIPVAKAEGNVQPGYILAKNVPGIAMSIHHAADDNVEKGKEAKVTATADSTFVLSNALIEATFDAKGRLISLYDRQTAREVVAAGQQGNRLMIYEDVPAFWDAWDVEFYYAEKGCDADQDAQVKIGEQGPLLASIIRTVKISSRSTMVQEISLTCASSRIDFASSVDWHENHRLLKVAFPVNVRCDVASYETPFGIVKRPTHSNTSWDFAKFEVCAQRFADISEYDYGVALLNDCKYGYSVRGNVMTLSLLRSPKSPDGNCDMGQHSFKYALFPHAGTVETGGVLAEALALNAPLIACPVAGSISKTSPALVGTSFFALEPAGCSGSHSMSLVVSSIKAAEEEAAHVNNASNNFTIVVRLYESCGGRGWAKFVAHPRFKIQRVVKCNILEQDQEIWDVGAADGGILIQYSPFQVITFKVDVLLS